MKVQNFTSMGEFGPYRLHSCICLDQRLIEGVCNLFG
ncbi:hypothetical protein I3843_07G128700 [Carya illinoinensis]|nr:hypothetical protein I3843_07G128700 [Carya illinoinensis]KAG7971326.1 hypothetical protein I3843_07G128700 [Carya illinoinensis]